MLIDQIRQKLQDSFPDSEIRVEDMTGGGDHFEVFVESPSFKGLRLLEQHRMVYDALGAMMDGPVHALKVNTRERKMK